MFIVSAGSCNQQKAITPTLKMSNSLSCQQNLLLGMKKYFFSADNWPGHFVQYQYC